MKKLFLITVLFQLTSAFYIEEKKLKQEWHPFAYQNHSGPQDKIARDILAKINFPRDAHVLDIGCGVGDITASIALRVPEGHVTGVDASSNMIKNAKETYNSRENLSFVHADATKYDFEKELDAVVAFSSLHWIKNQQQIVNQIAQNLKPHGIFLATLALDRNDNSIHPLIKAMVETACSVKWKKYAL